VTKLAAAARPGNIAAKTALATFIVARRDKSISMASPVKTGGKLKSSSIFGKYHGEKATTKAKGSCYLSDSKGE
jgi:hypothetical protein